MKKILSVIAVLAFATPLFAQNINPSVQVTNDYLTRFADFQKQGPAMQVPDSLFRFDYNFDYSVFDSPYRGAYDFSPYRIEVTPQARGYEGRSLYVRAGAGFSFHPQVELAWQSLLQENYSFGVLASLDGYAGKYRRRGVEGSFSGHDLSGRIGAGGRYLTPATQLSYQIAYEGIFAGEDIETPRMRSAFHTFFLSGGVKSRENTGSALFYDVDLQYRYSSDFNAKVTELGRLGENHLRAGVSVGPELDSDIRILLDARFEMNALRDYGKLYGELFSKNLSGNLVSFRPHAQFKLGPARLDAGIRLDYTVVYGQDPARRFTVAPDVTARMDVPDADLELFAGISGGQALEGLYNAKQINHFIRLPESVAGVSREKLRVRAGLQGHWGSRLQYELEGGYASFQGAPMAALYAVLPTDYKAAYGRMRGVWKSERLLVDGGLSYSYMRFYEGAGAYTPPAFTADLRGEYVWMRSIRAGAFVEAASSRLLIGGGGEKIPGFVNLGLTGAWQIDPRWSLWAEAGNLLGMAIERAPGFVEKSPWLSVGFSFKM